MFRRSFWFLVIMAGLTAASLGQVAGRVSYLDGRISHEQADRLEWEPATVNLPLFEGDRFLSAQGARLELELNDGSFLRLGPGSDMVLHRTDEGRTVVRLLDGSLILRSHSHNSFILATEKGRLETKTPGLYRLALDPQTGFRVLVRDGMAKVFTPDSTQTLMSGQSWQQGQSVGSVRIVNVGYRLDPFDLWSDRRDSEMAYPQDENLYLDTADSNVAGYSSLVSYGSWGYSTLHSRSVWYPQVGAGWCPYRFGRWSLYPGAGWTWISSEPWGWLPYHYGNWFWDPVFSRWGWVPGSFRIWKPATVNFFFWNGFIGWAPHLFGQQVHVPKHRSVIMGPRSVIQPPRGITFANADDFFNGGAATDSFRVPENESLVRVEPFDPIRQTVTTTLGKQEVLNGRPPRESTVGLRPVQNKLNDSSGSSLAPGTNNSPRTPPTRPAVNKGDASGSRVVIPRHSPPTRPAIDKAPPSGTRIVIPRQSPSTRPAIDKARPAPSAQPKVDRDTPRVPIRPRIQPNPRVTPKPGPTIRPNTVRPAPKVVRPRPATRKTRKPPE